MNLFEMLDTLPPDAPPAPDTGARLRVVRLAGAAQTELAVEARSAQTNLSPLEIRDIALECDAADAHRRDGRWFVEITHRATPARALIEPGTFAARFADRG